METFDVTSLQGLHQKITRIVDFKESATAGRVFSTLILKPLQRLELRWPVLCLIPWDFQWICDRA